MKLKKITIENYKSIKKIEINIEKYGSSYTTIFVGINESGKSNILEAMSYLNTPDEEFDYDEIHCKKDKDNNPIKISYEIEFTDKNFYLSEIKKNIKNSEMLDLKIYNISKVLTLVDGDDTFDEDFVFDIEIKNKSLFVYEKIEQITNSKGQIVDTNVFTIKETKEEADVNTNIFSKEYFLENFSDITKRIIKNHIPNVSFWKPSKEYLLSEVDLNTFKDNIDSNIPLKHIFFISGYENATEIKNQIEKINSINPRRQLQKTLSNNITNYVNNIWKHEIEIDIEIADSGKCSVSIKDKGGENDEYYHDMDFRSDGFKQFISLILSISIETKIGGLKNELILIDEPEIHLHPSGIRDIRKELLSMGENNYIFVSTHSPFLIDKRNKERHIIIKKTKALTEKFIISKEQNILDDEVLREAFGIEVYKDLMNPHSILVEGYSDKKILLTAIKIMEKENVGIVNGHGSNIISLAEKLNDTDIPLSLVLLDDDSDGKKYKNNIIKSGGSYTANNVKTIRDINGNIIESATIEDTLGKNFIESKFKEWYKKEFTIEIDNFIILENSPFISQIKTYLQKEAKENTNELISGFKIFISEEFNPSKKDFDTSFPLLYELVNNIYSDIMKVS